MLHELLQIKKIFISPFLVYYSSPVFIMLYVTHLLYFIIHHIPRFKVQIVTRNRTIHADLNKSLEIEPNDAFALKIRGNIYH